MIRFVHNLPDQTIARLRRGFWVLLLIFHAPGLLRIFLWSPSGHSAQVNTAAAIGLVLACTLFILKIFGVKWLRFKTDRRSIATLALAVVVAHLNLLRFSDEALTDPAQPLLISNILMASNLVSVRRILRQSLRWADGLRSTPKQIQTLCGRLQPTYDWCPPQCLRLSPTAPRAPPQHT